MTVLLEYFGHNGATFTRVCMDVVTKHFILHWHCVNAQFIYNGQEHITVLDHTSINSPTTLLVRNMILLFIEFCEAYQRLEPIICNNDIPLLSENLK